jgi:UDP-glucose/iron transport system permease protein
MTAATSFIAGALLAAPPPPAMEATTAIGPIPLSAWDLAVATVLVLLAGAISLSLRLHLERRLAIASVRTVVQLLLVGYILRFVFELDHWLPILGVALVMTLFAGRAAVQRPSRTFRGATWRACLTLVLTGFVTVFLVTEVIIGADPWYKPQYLIPLLGMILGNALTGISLSIDSLLESLSVRRAEIEMHLAHGATSWEAARDAVAEAVRRGLIPIINAMMVVGIVSLPGMMTGQILSGTDPLEAVKYQIVVMFMIAAAAALGSIGTALLVYRRLFTARHQLRSGLIRKVSSR